MRTDLLALSDDDLVALTNRGTVKRARAEVEAGAPSVELAESEDGTVTARWADDVECTLPPGLGLPRGRCSCIVEPPCRHLVRTAMAYRRWAADRAVASADSASPPSTSRPAVAAVPEAVESRARKLFEQGQLFELARSHKPIARCHSLGVVTRFFVPGDPNHAVCDCGEPAPCVHAVMALWAFERLPDDVHSGLVDSRTSPYPIPTPVLDEVESALVEWARVGVADAPKLLLDRLDRLGAACRRSGLSWVADGLDDLATLKAAYDARDARFEPSVLCDVVGELVARRDAIASDRGLVPPVFVRGSSADRTLEIGSARFVGVGCGVRVRRGSLELSAYLQSEDTGQVVAVVRDVKHSPTATTALSEHARLRVTKGIPFADLASGRTLVKGGKRSSGCVFTFGRAPAACQPQAFAWERLRAPLLAEGFAEVRAHLDQLPPKPLRPRRVVDDVYVIAVEGVERSGFDPAEQAVHAVLVDASGERALLVHPFHARAASGTNALLAALGKGGVRFVSGRVRRAARGLAIEPFGVVVERDGVRRLIKPWIEASRGPRAEEGYAAREREVDPGAFVVDEMPDALGSLLVLGVEGFTEATARELREHARQAEALGFATLPDRLRSLADAPDAKAVLELAAFAAFAGPG